MRKETVEIVRGNRWTASVGISLKADPAFDWTGTTAVLRFRKNRTHALSTPALLTINPTVTVGTGRIHVVIDLLPSQSSPLPDSCAADLLIQRTDSPEFGPLTPVGYDITFTPTT